MTTFQSISYLFEWKLILLFLKIWDKIASMFPANHLAKDQDNKTEACR